MINRYKFENWKKPWPSNNLEYMFTPCGIGMKIANFIFQKLLRINGESEFMVHYTSQVNGNIKFGKNVAKSFANSGSCYIQGINGVIIGDDTIFAPGVKIISANHSINSLSAHDKEDPVKIGQNCWIGANAVILPGVNIGNNVIIAAGAVVTKSCEANVILAGIPARPISLKNG